MNEHNDQPEAGQPQNDYVWQKAPFVNPVRPKPSPAHFARVRLIGKLIQRRFPRLGAARGLSCPQQVPPDCSLQPLSKPGGASSIAADRNVRAPAGWQCRAAPPEIGCETESFCGQVLPWFALLACLAPQIRRDVTLINTPLQLQRGDTAPTERPNRFSGFYLPRESPQTAKAVALPRSVRAPR